MTNALPPQGTDVDIVALIEADHRAVRALFGQLVEAAPAGRSELWQGLVQTLAVHEVAEEVVLFPAVRVVTSEYDDVLDARIEEQKHAEQLLADMEDVDPGSEEFTRKLGRLRHAVLEHAGAEEREVLPVIVRFGDSLDRPTLGGRYELAKRRAPSHPHPDAPHRPPGNVVTGPLMSVFDRVRDHLG